MNGELELMNLVKTIQTTVSMQAYHWQLGLEKYELEKLNVENKTNEQVL